MGVPWEDCDVVAQLLGTKTFLNEFVAYVRLSDYINNRRLSTGLRTISVSDLFHTIHVSMYVSGFDSVEACETGPTIGRILIFVF